MDFSGITYRGDAINDSHIYDALPRVLQDFYAQINGLVAFDGGLQIHGCVKSPDWFALRHAIEHVHAHYDTIRSGDIPFAQDCLGDHYVLSDSMVVHLNGETGEIDPLEISFEQFLIQACENPVDFLSLQPLERYKADGGALKPGNLLNVYPPFSMQTDDQEYSLKAIDALEQRNFLTDYYAQIKNLRDGQEVQIVAPK